MYASFENIGNISFNQLIMNAPGLNYNLYQVRKFILV